MCDARYDQRVPGFILCEDVPKISFLTPQSSALVFFATTKNFQDKYILMYFGGSHPRARAAMAEWFRAPVLETYDLGSIIYLAIAFVKQKLGYIKSSILIFFDYDKIVDNIICLTLHMISGSQISFSVKMSQKSAFYDLKLSS